jgi:hypothetical protein
MTFSSKKLFGLLPSFHRLADIDRGTILLTDVSRKSMRQLQDQLDALTDPNGPEGIEIQAAIAKLKRGPIEALLTIIADQVGILEENLNQLYDDQFIETCAEWVVPYIGDLIGVRGLQSVSELPFSHRAEVANTISYRRRKGTATVIQQLAQNITGWDASVVEYFQWLATTQYVKHVRPSNLSMLDLRDKNNLVWLNTPFDRSAHNCDVRSIISKRGKYNLPNIGIFLWRIQSFPSTQTPAFKVDLLAQCKRFLFNALGRELPLYQHHQPEKAVTRLADIADISMPLKRQELLNNLDIYYGPSASLQVFSDGVAVSPDQISICDLSDIKDSLGNVTGWNHFPTEKVSIDPELGRLSFPGSLNAPTQVNVSYYYGSPAAIGGGEYGRTDSFVSLNGSPLVVPRDKPTIQQALDALSESGGTVEIQSSEYHFENLSIQVNNGNSIELRAADGHRPIVVSDAPVRVWGDAGSNIFINGLVFTGGSLNVPLKDSLSRDNKLAALHLEHCTFSPASVPTIGTIVSQPATNRLVVESSSVSISIDKCIWGGIISNNDITVNISDSIIDSGRETGIAYGGLTDGNPGASLNVSNSTIIGKVFCSELNASNTIFKSALTMADTWLFPVLAEKIQQGCTRFCYVPFGSKVPHPFRCQPANANMVSRVQPVFTSLLYGDPGYGQLDPSCVSEISSGADDGSEMGVYHQLFQTQRLDNLQARLNEYLRFGLEAGIFLAS